jgi:hypothetical protein
MCIEQQCHRLRAGPRAGDTIARVFTLFVFTVFSKGHYWTLFCGVNQAGSCAHREDHQDGRSVRFLVRLVVIQRAHLTSDTSARRRFLPGPVSSDAVTTSGVATAPEAHPVFASASTFASPACVAASVTAPSTTTPLHHGSGAVDKSFSRKLASGPWILSVVRHTIARLVPSAASRRTRCRVKFSLSRKIAS